MFTNESKPFLTLAAIVAMFWVCGTSFATADDPWEQHNRLMSQAIANDNAYQVKQLLKTPYIDFEHGYHGRQHVVAATERAAKTGSVQILQLLLDGGASLSVSDEQSHMTVFHVAAGEHNPQLIQFLANQFSGPVPQLVNITAIPTYYTPLHILAELASGTTIPNDTSDSQSARILLHLGANPNILDNLQRSVLAVAIMRNHSADFVQLLLDNGANPDEKLRCDWTPLMIAVWARNGERLKRLAKATHDIDARDACGLDAVDITYMRNVIGDRWLFSETPVYQPEHDILINAGAKARPLPSSMQCTCHGY